jgi:hypothetical protein
MELIPSRHHNNDIISRQDYASHNGMLYKIAGWNYDKDAS